jgi:Tol biopolymer transport system component
MRRRWVAAGAAVLVATAACGGLPEDAARLCDEGELLVSSRGDDDVMGGSEVYLLSSHGASGEVLTGQDVVATDPSFSPDGSQIVFVSYVGDFESAGPAASSLAVLDLETREISPITTGPDLTSDFRDPANQLFDEEPEWAPTTDEVVYVHRALGQERVHTVVPGDEPALLVPGPDSEVDSTPTWSPDGRQVAFLRSPRDGGRVGLWVVNSDGTNALRLHEFVQLGDAELTWLDGDQLLIGDRGGVAPAFVLRLSSRVEFYTGVLGADFVAATEGRFYARNSSYLLRVTMDGRRVRVVEHLDEIGSNYRDAGLDVISCSKLRG